MNFLSLENHDKKNKILFSEVYTASLRGIEVDIITIQISISNGLPSFSIVGLPDKMVAESRERVRSALNFIGFSIPPKKILVNMSPANIYKEGTQYDLPIALSILSALNIIDQDVIKNYICMGELSINGDILMIPGVLCAGIKASATNKGIVCPASCVEHAFWSGNKNILASQDLISLINHFNGFQSLPIFSSNFTDDMFDHNTFEKNIQNAQKYFLKNDEDLSNYTKNSIQDEKNNKIDMQDVVGQVFGKRALEVSAAGSHNLLFIGPPGVGKSMLANRIVTILPDMTPKEMLEVAMIRNLTSNYHLITKKPPFVAPHHSASMVSIIGGGTKPKPGEISFAHNGVLFLDELPEFSRDVLESLRQPLESGFITISRLDSVRTYFSKFQFIAAMNLCMCGNYGKKPCATGPKCAEMYRRRVSKPILDRIDLQCYLPELNADDIAKDNRGEPSIKIAKRVKISRNIQYLSRSTLNAFLSPDQMKSLKIMPDALELLSKCAEKFQISMRERDKILKVSRTCADIEIAKMYENIQNAEQIFDILGKFGISKHNLELNINNICKQEEKYDINNENQDKKHENENKLISLYENSTNIEKEEISNIYNKHDKENDITIMNAEKQNNSVEEIRKFIENLINKHYKINASNLDVMLDIILTINSSSIAKRHINEAMSYRLREK